MLTEIQIQNYVIADQVELNLQAGMTALTGETGAGKSILLDAIGLVLGDRADSAAVKQGAERTDITASFLVDKLESVKMWLNEHELESDELCHIRRIVGADGRSRAFINGVPAPLSLLRELGEQLVDIHGQHEHQSLMKKTVQLQILDRFAQIEAQVTTLAEQYRTLKRNQDRLERLNRERENTLARKELLQFQVDELAQLNLAEDDYEKIGQRHLALAHADETVAVCGQAAWLLAGDEPGNVTDNLRQCLQLVQRAADFDPSLSDNLEILESALIQIQEASAQLRQHADSTDANPAELASLENQLQTIHDLARKHRCEPTELVHLLTSLQQELKQLSHSETEIDQLGVLISAQKAAWYELAKEVSQARAASAQTLSARITNTMQELGMQGGEFAISLTQQGTEPAINGLEMIEFLVAANAGQQPRPLAKVASGGELARISLALQVAAAGTTAIPTLIFDEVDSGIGGAIAEIVGQKLRELGSSVQVICVTHLAQVASQAHQHFRVCKSSEAGETSTSILPVQEDKRVEEIARMLGGVKITETTLRHASEMIARPAE